MNGKQYHIYGPAEVIKFNLITSYLIINILWKIGSCWAYHFLIFAVLCDSPLNKAISTKHPWESSKEWINVRNIFALQSEDVVRPYIRWAKSSCRSSVGLQYGQSHYPGRSDHAGHGCRAVFGHCIQQSSANPDLHPFLYILGASLGSPRSKNARVVGTPEVTEIIPNATYILACFRKYKLQFSVTEILKKMK